MATKGELIRKKAVEILKSRPEGVRYSQLVNELHQTFSDIPVNTIHGSIWDLDKTCSSEVYKADRGLFRHIDFRGTELVQQKEIIIQGRKGLREEDFYQPFAEFLKNELEECTHVQTLGGSKFEDRWATPDVIGVWRTTRYDPIHGEEIVSAEIKLDESTGALITAFGQACAYRLFSHKVYLVIPDSANEKDKSRIESLCLLYGVGLILFDSTNKDNQQFEIRVRATKHEPDLYYVNHYMKKVPELFS
jgi:hypothetical protein